MEMNSEILVMAASFNESNGCLNMMLNAGKMYSLDCYGPIILLISCKLEAIDILIS